MRAWRIPRVLGLCAAVCLLAAAATRTSAGADEPCELKLRGHSIVRLMLIEKSRMTGVQFETPGQSVPLPAGQYRVEQVDLEEGYSLTPRAARHEWFDVTPEGPNELVVGAPLYPTASIARHGRFLQLDYDLVDDAGRSYQKSGDHSEGLPTPPRFSVFKDGLEIGSGSFEYG